MKEGLLGRRSFLKSAVLGAAGFLSFGPETASAMMGGHCMMNGAGFVANPPPGAALKEPPILTNLSQEPGLVEVAIEAKRTAVALEGQRVNLFTYNGHFVGPTIKIKRGDRLRIRFKNSLPLTRSKNMLGHDRDITNLHTHGFHVSPSGNADNVHRQFAPGQSFIHEYETSKQAAGALCFYHPHVHGAVAEQYWAGLAGALIIEDPDATLAGYETHLLILKDLSLWGSDPEPYGRPMEYMMGKEGAFVLVNGQINPIVSTRPGQVQRWRILNASNARFYDLSLENHEIYLIGTDGGLVDKPYPVRHILLSPGERIDLLVRAKAPGYSRLISMPYNRGGCHGNLQTVTLMTVACEGERIKGEIPPVINREARRLAMDMRNLPYRRMSLGMGGMRGFINGRTFGHDTYTVESRVGTCEFWEVVNMSHMDHPFHQHVNEAQVVSIWGGDPEYAALYSTIPAWKDTVLIPKMGGVALLIPVLNYTGSAMMHCHILEHEDIGMMGLWNIA